MLESVCYHSKYVKKHEVQSFYPPILPAKFWLHLKDFTYGLWAGNHTDSISVQSPVKPSKHGKGETEHN